MRLPGAAALIRVHPMMILLLLTVPGCTTKIAPVSGIVTFEDGSPVTSGRIEFRSLKSGERFAGRIDQNGRFSPRDVHDQLGLPAGNYEVVVVQLVLTEDLAAELHDHGHTVPRRYADYYTSPLRVEVASDVSEIEISLSIE